MTPWLLFAVFGVTGYAAPVGLVRFPWLSRSPQLALVAWLATAVTAALALVLAIATVAVPTGAAGHGLADLWHACLSGWRHYYGDSSGVAVVVAIVALFVTVGNMLRAAVVHRCTVAAFRRSQNDGLSMLGASADRIMVVLPHPMPVAYCVPGRPGRVVLTDGAVRMLASDQLRAVIAHERAHLIGHHALLISLATVLEHGLGWTAPVFGRARREVAALVEIVADGAAARECAGRRVAAALVVLAEGSTPSAALAASGSFVLRRVRLLLSPPVPLAPVSRLLTMLCFGAFLTLPLVTVLGPAVAVLTAASCAGPQHA